MKIIVDLFNQHGGDFNELLRLAHNSFFAGADAVKIQLIDSHAIWGDDSRKYLELTRGQFEQFVEFCEVCGIPWMATCFTGKHVDWLDGKNPWAYKIASVTSSARQASKETDVVIKKTIEFAEKTERNCFISHGLSDIAKFNFASDSIVHWFCVSKYPTLLTDPDLKDMPLEFGVNGYRGFSDHSLGMGAGILALARGAEFLEKHITSNKSLQRPTQLGHSGAFDLDELRLFRKIAEEVEVIQCTQP